MKDLDSSFEHERKLKASAVDVKALLKGARYVSPNSHIGVLDSDFRKGEKNLYIPVMHGESSRIGHYFQIYEIDYFDVPEPTLLFNSGDALNAAILALRDTGCVHFLVIPYQVGDFIRYGLYYQESLRKSDDVEAVQDAVASDVEGV